MITGALFGCECGKFDHFLFKFCVPVPLSFQIVWITLQVVNTNIAIAI